MCSSDLLGEHRSVHPCSRFVGSAKASIVRREPGVAGISDRCELMAPLVAGLRESVNEDDGVPTTGPRKALEDPKVGCLDVLSDDPHTGSHTRPNSRRGLRWVSACRTRPER